MTSKKSPVKKAKKWPVAVSVITPCHNQARFIGAAIESVQAQTYKGWEMLIVDDGSSDDSVKVIEKYVKKDRQLKFFQNKKSQGPARSRNKAIKAAKGRYIAFLDGDDIWYPNKLKTQLDFMKQKNAAFTYHWCDVISEDGKVITELTNMARSKTYASMAKFPTIAGGFTAIYDRAEVGTQTMPDIIKRQDLGLWLKILRVIPRAWCVQQKLGAYRMRKGSVSSNKRVGAAYTWQIYRKVEKLNFLTAAWYFLHYACNGVVNTFLKRVRR